MNWNKNISIFFSIFVLISGHQAQETLSAQQAVFNALKNNYDILISEKNEEIASKNNAWSEAGLFPTVTLQVGQNNIIQDNTKNPFTFTPGIILNQGFSPSLVVNANLFSGFQVRMSKQRLEQLEVQSKGNTAVIIESMIQDVMKAYYSALLQKERSELYKKVMEYSSRRLKYNEIKNQYSASNSLELLQLKNQYLTDSTNFLMQQLSYQNSLRNLVLLMNNSEDSTFNTLPELSDKLESILPNLDKDKIYKDLLENNQNLKNQFLALELQETNVEFQRSFLYPTLALQLSANPSYGQLRQLSGGQPGNPTTFNTQSLSYSGNLTLRYNIYNNWKSKRAVEVAKIQTEIGAMNVEKLKNTLRVNLTNQIALYEIRNHLVNVSSENLEYATKAYDLAQKRFDLGTVNSIDLIVFQNNYQNTLLQHYENLYNRIDTYLEIYRLSGNLGLVYEEK
jgi:outer membrane protein TolC